jgi:trk system potassium uptake protein TrkH
MHWLGGVGIVVLFVAVFPALGVGGRHLFYTEAAGPKSKGLSPRIKERSSILWRVYLVITLVEIGALMVTGLSLYQATIHALSTMGTGGFSTLNGSIGGFQNEAAEWVVLLFMLIAGTNFMLFYEAKTDGIKVFLKHAETKAYLYIFGFATIACTWSIYGQSLNVVDSVRDAGFQVAAIMTTTGYGTNDYELWPAFSKLILVGLFFVGGSSGSTAGGMKVYRVIVLVKAGVAELRRSFRPNLVRPLRIGGSVVSKEGVREVFTFCGMFAITVIVGAIVVAAIDNYDVTTSLMASLACVANVGPGLGLVGPTDNFGLFSDSTKLFLSTLMILGRLEILAVAALFLPSFWRR